jgi:ornithine carbamoyltransferase
VGIDLLREHLGTLAGATVAYVGDGNNTCHALLLAGAKVGMTVRVATPEGYEPDEAVIARARGDAAGSGGAVEITNDPNEAASDADVLYTDVWASMGHEAEARERERVFPPYQLNEELLAVAKPGALVMHCLPAHRGEEITDAVIDGETSVVLDQAENRLHTQKALLLRALDRLD